jgi:hypothetical protein
VLSIDARRTKCGCCCLHDGCAVAFVLQQFCCCLPIVNAALPMLVLTLLKQRVPFGSAPQTPALLSKLQQISIGLEA